MSSGSAAAANSSDSNVTDRSISADEEGIHGAASGGRSAPDNSIERDKDSTQEQGDALLEQAKKTGKEQQQSGSK